MPDFDYYIDRRFITWDREMYTVKADTQEQANAIMIEHFNKGAYSEDLEPDYVEDLLETREDQKPEDNDGEATRELFAGATPEKAVRLADNSINKL